MKKNILIKSLLAVSFVFTACSEFLDPDEYTMLTKEQIYSVSTYVRDMPFSAYSAIPSAFNHIGNSNLSAASDEAEEVNGDEIIQRFNNGSWSQYMNPDDEWGTLYKGIRIACDYLKETENLTWEEIRYPDPENYALRMKDLCIGRGEMRFIRAYLYFELMKRFGEVPLITDKVDMTSVDLEDYKRAPIESIVKFIIDECDIVSSQGKYKLTDMEKEKMMSKNDGLLPIPYRDNLAITYPTSGEDSKYLGRATAAAAMALKAKTLIYYASRLYNPDNDMSRWYSAAKACKAVIDLPSSSYALEAKYADLFQKKSTWSKEFIFVKKMSAFNSFDVANYPISISGGKSGTCPSQNLVDAYEMQNGSSFDWSNSIHAANPYQGRDPRLQMTVYVNGELFSTMAPNNIKLQCWEGGNSAFPIRYATKTGYYLKKYINPNLDLKLGKSDTKTWIYMRLADFYLYYAEAMNELYGPAADPERFGLTALQAINKVRDRSDVKMPAITDTDPIVFKKRLVNERRVELAFEEARYWDVRRWMYGQEFNKDLRGVSVTFNEKGELLYAPKFVEKRVFDETKMYFYPIPQSEINKSNGVLQQNDNW